jgi:hypothetical protein
VPDAEADGDGGARTGTGEWGRGRNGWMGGFARSVVDEAGNENFSPFLTPFFTLLLYEY